jgi:choline kinase
MSVPPDTAIILAAGMGTRLRSVHDEGPKGFVRLGDETLIERSLRLLEERGIARTLIVAGYEADAYHELAERNPALEIVVNEAFATTGTMASLDLALERVDDDFLLLESDLFYEARALDVLLESTESDVLLASGPTNAGDEYWVEAPGHMLMALSNQREQIKQIDGEMVGILKISSTLAAKLSTRHRQLVDESGHEQFSYETDALAHVALSHPVHVVVVEDLIWGELDDEVHWRRLQDRVLPEWFERCSLAEAERSRAAATERSDP